jgi:predicted nuclease of restriction endonuclease-like (RecB) superfamily
MSSEGLSFSALVAAIAQAHDSFSARASKAVNISLTLRNWFIGHHIAEYELQGADRAAYGDRLLESLLFYEVETLRGNWSVRELKRQIATQYFERSGLSTDKNALARLTHGNAELQAPQHVIRDPYVFEFLGLRPQEVMTERRLEDALLDRLQQFLVELGHGFCFEARQKRIDIGGEHGFVDLVFYHRILKCHVLVELKNDAFRHEHLGQLNAYVGWYKQHQMTAGDKPPIGILLCTQKNHEMVRYALAGMTNRLFVSRYQLRLPDAAAMEGFLRQALEELGPSGAGSGDAV